MDNQVGIVGMGHVGTAVRTYFPDAICYDKHLPGFGPLSDLQNLGIVFVCVPTPTGDNGLNTSAVEEVADWLEADIIVVKSTVPPRFTRDLSERTGKRLVFAPEFFGEWRYPTPWNRSPEGWPYHIFGGEREDTARCVDLYASVLGAERSYFQTTWEEAELCKLMENAWLANQVSFATEIASIAQGLNVDFWEVRELWALDDRVSKSHTVPAKEGFGGKCLPKDVQTLVCTARLLKIPTPLLDGVLAHATDSTV